MQAALGLKGQSSEQFGSDGEFRIEVMEEKAAFVAIRGYPSFWKVDRSKS